MLRIKIYPNVGKVFFVELYETEDQNQVDNFMSMFFADGLIDFYEVEYQ